MDRKDQGFSSTGNIANFKKDVEGSGDVYGSDGNMNRFSRTDEKEWADTPTEIAKSKFPGRDPSRMSTSAASAHSSIHSKRTASITAASDRVSETVTLPRHLQFSGSSIDRESILRSPTLIQVDPDVANTIDDPELAVGSTVLTAEDEVIFNLKSELGEQGDSHDNVFINPRRLSQPPAPVSSRERKAPRPRRLTNPENKNLPEEPSIDETKDLPADKAEAIRHLRLLKVMHKRHDRTNLRIDNYLRLQINVGSAVQFPLTVDKRHSIESLAHLIEAEYTFRYLVPQPSTGEENARSKRKQQEDVKYDPVEIGLLIDETGLSLNFADSIGDVLDMDHHVFAMNIYQDRVRRKSNASSVIPASAPGEMPRRQSGRKLSSLFSNMMSSKAATSQRNGLGDIIRSNGSLSGSNGGLADIKSPDLGRKRSSVNAPTPLSMVSNAISMLSLEDRFQLLLHNPAGLQQFHQFCLRNCCMELFVFWLDVELFTELSPTMEPEDKRLYVIYLYMTYITPNAPLKVNLPEEVTDDIRWPIPRGEFIDSTMFDEAQERSYDILRGHLFFNFEKTSLYTEYLTFSGFTPSSPLTNKIELYSTILKPDPRGFLTRMSTDPHVSGSTLFVPPEADEEKDALLGLLMERYFPQSPYLPLQGYFTHIRLLCAAQKRRKMLKEKKLQKFFGQRPSSQLMQQQFLASADPTKVAASYVEDPLADEQQPDVNSYHELNEELSAALSGSLSKLAVRRKKFDKLNGFFGGMLPKDMMVRQHLASDTPPSASDANVDKGTIAAAPGNQLASGLVVSVSSEPLSQPEVRRPPPQDPTRLSPSRRGSTSQ